MSMVIVSCYAPATSEGKSQQQNSPSYKYDFSSLYNPSESSLHPDVRIYSESESQAIVFFRISIDEIRANQKSVYDTSFNLVTKYALRDVSTFEITDSGSNTFNIDTDIDSEYVELYFRIKMTPKTNYKLIVGFTGPKSGSGSRLIFDVDNMSDFAKEMFIPEKDEDGFSVLYNNFVESEKIYRINSKIFDANNFEIEYYSFPDYIVLPPYFTVNIEDEFGMPDSVYKYIIGDTLRFDSLGYYVIKPSSEKYGSLCLLNSGGSFPEINKLSEMYEPLKLVATAKELKSIASAEILKVAIDQFWLEKSNNKKFAREQIRVFYNRVELANKYFSDHREGWKTDRGNLYVVLGPPTIVNMSSDGEEWFYGENPDIAGVLFIFEKGQSVTGSAVYRLQRDPTYQPLWAQAISTWRNGRVFTITKN